MCEKNQALWDEPENGDQHHQDSEWQAYGLYSTPRDIPNRTLEGQHRPRIGECVFTVGASGGDGKAARNAAVHELSYIFSGLPHDVHGLGQSADGFVAGKSEGMGPSASIQGTSVSL